MGNLEARSSSSTFRHYSSLTVSVPQPSRTRSKSRHKATSHHPYLYDCNKDTRDKTEFMQNSPPTPVAQSAHTNAPEEGRKLGHIQSQEYNTKEHKTPQEWLWPSKEAFTVAEWLSLSKRNFRFDLGDVLVFPSRHLRWNAKAMKITIKRWSFVMNAVWMNEFMLCFV